MGNKFNHVDQDPNAGNLTDFFKDHQFEKPKWDGMPEFKQNDKEAFHRIVVRFDNEEDIKKFGEQIGSDSVFSTRTKSVRYPLVAESNLENHFAETSTKTKEVYAIDEEIIKKESYESI